VNYVSTNATFAEIIRLGETVMFVVEYRAKSVEEQFLR
jgi:hypothetical protein